MRESNNVTCMMEKLIPYLNRDAQIAFLLTKHVLSQTKTCLLMKQEVNAGLVPVNNYPLLPKPNIIFDYIRLCGISIRKTCMNLGSVFIYKSQTGLEITAQP